MCIWRSLRTTSALNTASFLCYLTSDLGSTKAFWTQDLDGVLSLAPRYITVVIVTTLCFPEAFSILISALNTATKSGPCCAVFFRMMHQKNNGLSKNTEYMTTIATAGSTVPQAGHLQAAQKPTKTTKSQKSNRKPKPPKAKSHQKPRATESEPAFLPSFLPGFVSFLFF